MATIEQAKHKAGRMLGITRYGQALKADDDLLLDEAYASVYDDLDKEGVAVWPSDGDIPDGCLPHIAALMAFSVAPDKSVSGERYNLILTNRNVAKPEIRKQVTPSYESLDQEADY